MKLYQSLKGTILSEIQAAPQNRKKRNNLLAILAGFFIISGIAYAIYYTSYAKFYESTDNAYVGQNIIYVTPQASGNIDKIFVSEMQYVKEGEILAHIDSRNAELAFNKAKANLASSVRKIKQLHIQIEEAKNAIALAKVNVEKTQDDLKRNEYLAKNNAISDETYKNLKYANESALQNLEIMKKKLSSLQAVIQESDIAQNPQVQNNILNLERCYLDLKRCDIIAPQSGIVAKKNFSIGENVSKKSTLLAIVPTEGFWVDANFKETQLEHIKLNQNVTLDSDQYGKDIVYHGKVKGVAPGTGAVFSLLPAQNATGNWIKIVQRIPVRIQLDPKEVKEHPLQVGSSMDVTIDVHEQNTQELTPLQVNRPNEQSSKLYQNTLAQSEQIAKRIIEQNL